MNNVCSGHELKAAEYAQRAALNYKKAAPADNGAFFQFIQT